MRKTWDTAIAIAKDFSQVAGANASRIHDRYGEEGADEEELEFVGQAMADKVVAAILSAKEGE